MANLEHARAFAADLAELGCRLALDDFGSGFASFFHLKHLVFDDLKIDGGFIRELPTSTSDRLTVEAIVGIAHGLGKTTTAEYVTDDATLELVGDVGVDYAQGYAVGEPRPVEDVVGAAPAATA